MGVLPEKGDETDTAAAPKGGGQRSEVGGQNIKPRPLVADGGSAKSAPKTKGEQQNSDPGSMTATLAAPSPQSRAPETNGHTNGHANGYANGTAATAALLARAGVFVKGADGPNTARSEQFAEFQSDAPACDNCGAITVRNGNCYLCHNCGSSMGCS